MAFIPLCVLLLLLLHIRTSWILNWMPEKSLYWWRHLQGSSLLESGWKKIRLTRKLTVLLSNLTKKNWKSVFFRANYPNFNRHHFSTISWNRISFSCRVQHYSELWWGHCSNQLYLQFFSYQNILCCTSDSSRNSNISSIGMARVGYSRTFKMTS